MFLKYISALMAAWYCMSIIGFDVHACASTGDVFINSVLAGTTCEDIHPEHGCDSQAEPYSCSCCCAHQRTTGDAVESDGNCCTNEVKVLDSESLNVQNDDVYSQYVACSAFVPAYNFLSMSVMAKDREILYYPDPGCVLKPDLQAVFNIWRV